MDFLYQDEALLVVNKPAGLLVHPTRGARDRRTCMSLVRDAVGQHVFPIHRLDRGTSGVLVLCRSSVDARLVCRQFEQRTVEKVYWAVTRGWLTEAGVQEGPIDGKPARTEYSPVSTCEVPLAVGRFPTARYSLVEVRPRTGVNHQIRRHLRRLNHPVVGDTKHGDKDHNLALAEHFSLRRLALHAARLDLVHPRSQENLRLTAPLPLDLKDFLESLGLAFRVP